MATHKETSADLKRVQEQQVKIAQEVKALQTAQDVTITQVTELEASLVGNAPVTPELIAAVATLKAQIHSVKDLIPNVTVLPPS